VEDRPYGHAGGTQDHGDARNDGADTQGLYRVKVPVESSYEHGKGCDRGARRRDPPRSSPEVPGCRARSRVTVGATLGPDR